MIDWLKAIRKIFGVDNDGTQTRQLTSPEWEKVKELRETEELTAITATDPKTFFIFSPVPWIQGNMERMLGISLRLRGHSVDELICGGGFPACGMEHVNSSRPSCDDCIRQSSYWFDVWKLPVESTAAFRQSSDIAEAQKVVDQLGLERYVDMIYKKFTAMNFQGYPLGIRIYQQTHWYFSGNFTDSVAVLNYLRKCALSYIIGIGIGERNFSRKKYDALIVANGKTIEGGPIIDVAVKNNVRYITWEELIVFDHNSPVVEFNQHGVWEAVKDIELTSEQQSEVEDYFDQWKASKNTGWVYYKNPIEDLDDVTKQLKLREDSFKVALFPNLLLDSSIIGMHLAFDSIFDWVFSCIDYAIANPDIDLIIRCHPAEKINLGFLTGQVFIIKEIEKKYGAVPDNIILIESESQISSYALMNLVDIPITYTGTLSLEAPFYDRLCVVAGKTNLRGKGFTIDLETKEQLIELLDKREPLRRPTEQEKKYAYRYGYLYKVRMVAHPDFYDKKKIEFNIVSLRMLEAGAHPFWDNLCDSVVNKHAFLDLDKKDRVPVPLG